MSIGTRTAAIREDPRVKRTRKLLRDAFISLLGEKGFHAISVQDIAERATVNRATFYAHFLDKYDLFDQMAGETFRQALSGRVSVHSPFTQDSLEVLIVTAFETLAQIHDHCKPVVDRELNPLIEAKAQAEIKAFLSQWLRRLSGERPSQRVVRETTATVLSWAIFGAGIEWSRGARDRSAEEVARDVQALLTGSLADVLDVLPEGAPGG